MSLSKPSVAVVKAIIATTLADDAVQAVIDDAALLAEGCPVVASYDAARQSAIVKWLAAHMLASTSAGGGALTQKALGDASETYGRATLGTQLAGTTYGQQALALDPSGCLARLGAKRAFVRVV